jgi:hypothetical protein
VANKRFLEMKRNSKSSQAVTMAVSKWELSSRTFVSVCVAIDKNTLN